MPPWRRHGYTGNLSPRMNTVWCESLKVVSRRNHTKLFILGLTRYPRYRTWTETWSVSYSNGSSTSPTTNKRSPKTRNPDKKKDEKEKKTRSFSLKTRTPSPPFEHIIRYCIVAHATSNTCWCLSRWHCVHVVSSATDGCHGAARNRRAFEKSHVRSCVWYAAVRRPSVSESVDLLLYESLSLFVFCLFWHGA